jgi:cell division GTPase FtsZ
MSDEDGNTPYFIKGSGADGRPKTALIGCGGTGVNFLAEDVVEHADLRIAVGSEPRILEGLAQMEKVLVSTGRVERDAKDATRLSRLASNETERQLGDLLEGIDIAFILAGLGGYTGGWCASLAAKAARREKCIGLCVVSEPFKVEGRAEMAKDQLRYLMEFADGVLVLPNDMIISEAPNLPITKAFRVMNAILASPINLLSRSLGKDDLGAFREILNASQIFSMDEASWEGDNPTFSAVEQLANSKWLALQGGTVRSAIILSEGFLSQDDQEQLGTEFRRVVGKDARIILGHTDSDAKGLRVTAIVGY